MTPEQKDILIEKMIDRPASLTDIELEQIFADAELKELYDISVRLADELTPIPQIDTQAEWTRLRSAIASQDIRRRPARRWMGLAAAIAGILICGGVAVKFAITDASLSTPAENVAQVVTPTVKAPLPPAQAESEISEPETTPVEKKGQPSQKSIVPEEDEFDADEYLRIQQARMDNEAAMALSEVYEKEYEADMNLMIEMLAEQELDPDDPALEYLNEVNINQITML